MLCKQHENEHCLDIFCAECLKAELADARKKPEPGEYSVWAGKERQHLLDIHADCSRISAEKAWQVQQVVIDSLTTKNAELIKAFEGCSKCKGQYEDELKAKDKEIENIKTEIRVASVFLAKDDFWRASVMLEQALKEKD